MTTAERPASPARRVVGLCGSLRVGSFNGFALQLARTRLPAGWAMDILPWDDVPPFNADVLSQGLPPSVSRLRQQIAAAEGLVIATPEYNFSLPGMLKNLIDWLSRGEDQPLAAKPVAIISATTGPLGGARVQYDLRKVLLFVNASVLVKPEVFIGQASAKFDAAGQCTDSATAGFVGAQMEAFTRWIDATRRLAE